jgi:hypothetical protein
MVLSQQRTEAEMDPRITMQITTERHADQARDAAEHNRFGRARRVRLTRLSTIALRTAGPDDAPAIERLAELDSARTPAGEVLLAEVDGEAVAALSLADGLVVASPMVRTAEARALLELRATHLDEARPRRRGRLGLRAA